jgi:hypothetical protein
MENVAFEVQWNGKPVCDALLKGEASIGLAVAARTKRKTLLVTCF